MRLVFVHDHRFVRGDGDVVYTGGSLPATTWDRYLRHFDEIVVVAREGSHASDVAGLARSDHRNVHFKLIAGQEGARLLLPSTTPIEILKRELDEADALLAMLPSQFALLAVNMARGRGLPFAAEVIGCAWDSYFNYGHIAARAYAPIAYYRQRKALRQAHAALYVTREFLQQRYPCSGYTNYASNVEIEPMDERGHRSRARRLRELVKGRQPRFGTIGSPQTRYKGFHIAIGAIARLRANGLEVRYSILGPGDPSAYRALAEKHGVGDLVEFAGIRQPGAEVARWLDDIDVHIQPSFQEGLPRATVEAMNRGAACLGSTVGGLPELIPLDRMHRPGDVETLAEHISEMATDPMRVRAASKIDLETARDFFPDLLEKRRDEVFSRLRLLAEDSRGGGRRQRAHR